MRPNPTDVSCLHCGDAVPLRTAIITKGYCARCAPDTPIPLAGDRPATSKAETELLGKRQANWEEREPRKVAAGV